MLITQEELRKKFKGSDFIVDSFNAISHVCDGGHTILTYYEKDKTYIITISSESDYIGRLIDNSFLEYFKHTKLMSWYVPETEYYGKAFRMYELQEWR